VVLYFIQDEGQSLKDNSFSRIYLLYLLDLAKTERERESEESEEQGSSDTFILGGGGQKQRHVVRRFPRLRLLVLLAVI
jgi:hypothetical protein